MSELIGNVDNETLAKAAFERVKADFASLKTDELLQVSLDISQAVATVLGVLPEVKALREQIVKELPTFDIARFDKLEDYTLGLSFAQASYLSATQPPDDFNAVAQEAAGMRAVLLAEAQSLTLRGVVSDAQLAQLKGANGYKNVASDLQVLANVMEAVWPQIQGKTPTTPQDLDKASKLATRLLRLVGQREQGPAEVAQATDQRLRAYTTLLLAYDDMRRAVTYLRADADDADTIAPSLHPGRPSKKKAPVTPEPVTPPATATGGAPATGSAPAATPAAAPATSGASTPAATHAAGTGGPFM